MKHLPKILLLAGALSFPTLASAQSYDKAHQIQAPDFTNVIMPSLHRNQKLVASDVMALQFLLRNRGFYKAKVDGKFGDSTENAVRDFQRAKGLKVDGIVGIQTWPSLLLRLKQGDRGDAVRALQTLLRSKTNEDGRQLYPNFVVDGVFGIDTVDVVRYFQEDFGIYYKKKGLKVDGIVSSQTWGVLLRAQFAD